MDCHSFLSAKRQYPLVKESVILEGDAGRSLHAEKNDDSADRTCRRSDLEKVSLTVLHMIILQHYKGESKGRRMKPSWLTWKCSVWMETDQRKMCFKVAPFVQNREFARNK